MTKGYTYALKTLMLLYDGLFEGCQGAFVTSFYRLEQNIWGDYRFFIIRQPLCKPRCSFYEISEEIKQQYCHDTGRQRNRQYFGSI